MVDEFKEIIGNLDKYIKGLKSELKEKEDKLNSLSDAKYNEGQKLFVRNNHSGGTHGSFISISGNFAIYASITNEVHIIFKRIINDASRSRMFNRNNYYSHIGK